METLKEIILKNQSPKLSLREIAEGYKDIELNPEEMMEAIIWGKQKKEARLREEKLKSKQEENRKAITFTKWDFEQTRGYMMFRASELFEGKFLLDEENTQLFNLLSYYFSEDKEFATLAVTMGVYNPSLDKGIMIAGNFGTGKTWMMKLFSKNKRQVFHVKNAKYIANMFETDGEIAAVEFESKIKNAVNDKSAFYHEYAGLCIDDIGTEDVKVHYGNKRNVIGDIIENRYTKGNAGIFLHATTNLTADQLKSFYGERVTSRMREIFNFIDFSASDRRK